MQLHVRCVEPRLDDRDQPVTEGNPGESRVHAINTDEQQRKGVPLALVITHGHRNVLVARRSQIPGGLASWINWDPPPPLSPLERTLQVSERVDFDGREIECVGEEGLRKQLLPC